MVYQVQNQRRFAAMGGTYGNVPALKACIEDARNQQCEVLAFLGDGIGYCGHSDEIVDLIRDHFDILVAGNYEQQAESQFNHLWLWLCFRGRRAHRWPDL
jgi:hypothetical protein